MNGTFSLGVIGHVDHGKSAFVSALTGMQMDRLREERERGLSIALGFAYLETPRGVVDLIDTPGHENFIRTMISGATAIDGIVLCVAANEGVMPQTVEHFNISRLLGITHGIVVVTKSDLVDGAAMGRVRKQLSDFVAGTFLADAPVIEASTVTGAGIAAARDAIASCAATAPAQGDTGRFFLPLDRVFTMQGFGVVGTGTLRGGSLSLNDTVEIMPSGRQATVRGLQNHNRPVELAVPGQRVAVNLRGVDRDDLRRGDVLAVPGAIVPTQRVDAFVVLLGDARPLRNGTMLRLLSGTTEAMARVRLLDRAELEPGAEALAQLDLDRTIATRSNEPLLLRTVSPLHTIGGGRILAVNPARHRRFDAGVNRRLEATAGGKLEDILAQRLAASGTQGVDLGTLAEELGADQCLLYEAALHGGVVVVDGEIAVDRHAYDGLLHEIVETLRQYHSSNPLRTGMERGRLAATLGVAAGPEVLRHGLASLIERGALSAQLDLICLHGHDPFARLPERERRVLRSIEQAFLARGLEACPPEAVVSDDRASQVIYRLLLETGRLVELRTYERNSHRVLHAKSLEAARQALERAFPYPGAFAAKDVRDLLGSTRKHIVPLLEHFDSAGVTVRSGDVRRLRQ